MAESDEAKQLLTATLKDWNALKGMHDAEIFADEIFGFHAQQATEKALKAWLAWMRIEYPKTHDLTYLLGSLQAHGEDVEHFRGLIEFNPYAVQFRYDSFDEIGSALDRNDVLKRVGELIDFVNRKIYGV